MRKVYKSVGSFKLMKFDRKTTIKTSYNLKAVDGDDGSIRGIIRMSGSSQVRGISPRHFWNLRIL